MKPSKIVAGHEVEKTNEFLQMLAIAILKEVGVLYMYVECGCTNAEILSSRIPLKQFREY